MCGFCGLYGPPAHEPPVDRVRRMLRTIAHRGPDAEGVFEDEGIALGHRRLSILDLSPAGDQPMSLGSTTVVYNGESYNFRELRDELERAGCRFRGHSDTEVLLHAYRHWGLQGLERLEGLFAFALWDGERRRLVLMRDRLGIKPLFFAWHGGMLAFGSEIKAVLAAAPIERAVDSQALAEYLWYGNAFEDRTLFRSVRALQPGHRMVVEPGGARIEPWWRIERWVACEAPHHAAEAACAVRAAVDRAVTRQLVSDVPVALLLSGGVDSSSIAASAAAGGARSLLTFTIGFDYEKGGGELPKARAIARHLGLDHHELHVRGEGLEEVLERLVDAHDEPFADAANIPLYLLGRELHGAVKVLLQGDGGDEMFAGYRRYSILSGLRWWRAASWWIDALARTMPCSTFERVARVAAAAGQTHPAMRMALLLTLETLRDPPTAMLRPEVQANLAAESDPFAAFGRCAERFRGLDPVRQMLLTDACLQLPSQFLPKVDRAMMAHGIEARVPLLDEQVGSLATALPTHLKVSGRQKKIVLRDAMRARLPAGSLDGPKVGFGVPYENWLRGSLHSFARSMLLEPQFIERFGFDRSRIEQALGQHRSRKRERGFLLWKLLQLSIWSRRYLS
jgi:asparagine synthase (glutamine-hydrolysing)